VTFPRVKLTKHGKEEPSGFHCPDATYTSLDLSIYHSGTLLNQENHKKDRKKESERERINGSWERLRAGGEGTTEDETVR